MNNQESQPDYFVEKMWDTEFFGRRFLSGDLSREITTEGWQKLELEIEALKASGAWLLEARIRSSHFHNVTKLEDLGFRLVDSRLEFSTLTRRSEAEYSIPRGDFRWYQESDWLPLQDLTRSQFAANENFKSRYNNRRYFSEEESNRYYMQWHRWALENENPLFCVWEVDGFFAGFYSILRQAEGDSIPRYKVALAAVEPEFRSYGAQNQMQFWIFENAPDEEWLTINSPALTNLSGLKNNIRAAKELSYVEAYFFLELA